MIFNEQSTSGIAHRHNLSQAEQAAVQRLVQSASEHDGFALTYWIVEAEPVNVYLYYTEGTLVGFLALATINEVGREASGLVDPDRRRRGIFRALVGAALADRAEQPQPGLLLVCNALSESGRGFVQALRCSFYFAEYSMELRGTSLQLECDPALTLRPANEDDLDLLAEMVSRSFASPLQQALEHARWNLSQPRRHPQLAYLATTPIGTITLVEDEQENYIAGFGVIPEWRGRGYGRQILALAVRRIRAQSAAPVLLDVETGNRNALGLYRSCGFEQTNVYEYYALGGNRNEPR